MSVLCNDFSPLTRYCSTSVNYVPSTTCMVSRIGLCCTYLTSLYCRYISGRGISGSDKYQEIILLLNVYNSVNFVTICTSPPRDVRAGMGAYWLLYDNGGSPWRNEETVCRFPETKDNMQNIIAFRKSHQLQYFFYNFEFSETTALITQ